MQTIYIDQTAYYLTSFSHMFGSGSCHFFIPQII